MSTPPRAGNVVLICEQCKAEFRTWPYAVRLGKGRFCGPSCRNKSMQSRENVTRNCEHCGAAFTRLVNQKRAAEMRFCSPQCARDGRKSAEERLWVKINVDGPPPTHRPELGPCWLWKRKPTSHGYGKFAISPGCQEYAHRVVYRLLIGPIPPGNELDHLCRVTLCCNPFHLEPVTHHENLLRGVGASAIHAAQTHCIHGHPLSGSNVYIRRNGGRMCRTCQRIRSAKT